MRCSNHPASQGVYGGSSAISLAPVGVVTVDETVSLSATASLETSKGGGTNRGHGRREPAGHGSDVRRTFYSPCADEAAQQDEIRSCSQEEVIGRVIVM